MKILLPSRNSITFEYRESIVKWWNFLFNEDWNAIEWKWRISILFYISGPCQIIGFYANERKKKQQEMAIYFLFSILYHWRWIHYVWGKKMVLKIFHVSIKHLINIKMTDVSIFFPVFYILYNMIVLQNAIYRWFLWRWLASIFIHRFIYKIVHS